MQTKHDVKRILESAGRVPGRGPGQNFLVDGNLLRMMASLGELELRDVVWEVGTGTGALTELLAEKCDHVFTVDIDEPLQGAARRELASFTNITFILGDVLASKHAISPDVPGAINRYMGTHPDRNLKVVSNLPYNIATPFILNALAGKPVPVMMVVMVQREAAERLAGAPGTAAYGAASVMAQALAHVEVVRILSRHVFWPKPKVESAILRVTPRPLEEMEGVKIDAVKSLADVLFQHRRKRVLGVVRKYLGEEAFVDFQKYFERKGINPNARAQNLATVDFIRLAKYN